MRFLVRGDRRTLSRNSRRLEIGADGLGRIVPIRSGESGSSCRFHGHGNATAAEGDSLPVSDAIELNVQTLLKDGSS
ncbi:MAG: hypothetical protein FD138_2612 [Planctomycetota bacterium]|nr:MAG: hypothetical protein FD138_2612 [Planctomycetota bacterium]